VFRNVRRFAATRILVVVGVLTALTLLGACGEPPQPPLTAPPEAPGGGSASASANPSAILPTMPPNTLPTGGVLPTYPTAGLPTYPTSTTTPPPTTTSPTTPGPSPAAKCTSGPTAAQVIAVVKERPGIPEAELKVIDGPFCSGTWQFSIVEIAAADAEDEYEPLQVVSNGTPASLKVIEAGTDVCSLKVQNEAPPGIRVRACGA
jgi:hypothetical protein